MHFKLQIGNPSDCRPAQCKAFGTHAAGPQALSQAAFAHVSLSPADLTVRKPTARHQRMPSDEAILKVAKQHKLPAPELPTPLAAPTLQRLSQQHAQPPAAVAAQQTAVVGLAPKAAAAVGSAPVPSCMPLRLPASGSSSPVAAQHDADLERQASGAAGPASIEAQQQQEAAKAVYGEPWQARKARVQAASPHGRYAGLLPLPAVFRPRLYTTQACTSSPLYSCCQDARQTSP